MYVVNYVVRLSFFFTKKSQLQRCRVFWQYCFIWCKALKQLPSVVFFKPASDATQIFEETKHSVEAREMMQAFFVGIFVEVSKVIMYIH